MNFQNSLQQTLIQHIRHFQIRVFFIGTIYLTRKIHFTLFQEKINLTSIVKSLIFSSSVLLLEIQIIFVSFVKELSMMELWRLLLVIISFLPVIVSHLKPPSLFFHRETFFNDLRHLSISSTSINDFTRIKGKVEEEKKY